MVQATVIILNYNGVHFLEKFLPSVTQYSQGHRIIVADNASTDVSIPFLKKKYPAVEIMAFSQNYGFARGYNEALKQIDTPYSILLNSDVEVTPNWIEPVLALMEQQPHIAACQPKVRSYHQKTHFEHAGAAGGFIDRIAYPFCRGRILDILEEDTGQYDDARAVFWATGACFFVRTQLFLQFGGFDEIFHAHMEEIDLCWRMHALGYAVFCQPQSMVYHVGGGTMPATNPRKTYLNFRNSTGMLFKNTRLRQLWWKLPVKMLVDVVATFKFFVDRKFGDGKAVLQSMADFLLNIRKWIRHRHQVKRRLKHRHAAMLPGFLVVERYVKRKKRFSEISNGQFPE